MHTSNMQENINTQRHILFEKHKLDLLLMDLYLL